MHPATAFADRIKRESDIASRISNWAMMIHPQFLSQVRVSNWLFRTRLSDKNRKRFSCPYRGYVALVHPCSDVRQSSCPLV